MSSPPVNGSLDPATVEHVLALRNDRPERRLEVRARILRMVENRIARYDGECICDLIGLRDFVLYEQLRDKAGDA